MTTLNGTKDTDFVVAFTVATGNKRTLHLPSNLIGITGNEYEHTCKQREWVGMAAHTFNASTWEAEVS